MQSSVILIFYVLTLSQCAKDVDVIDPPTTTSKPQTKASVETFLELPEDIIIEYENASSYVKEQNHNVEHMMGVSDERCDNAKVIRG